MDTLRNQFRGTEHLSQGPYFIGYGGEHQSQHPGTVQLAGASFAERGGYPFAHIVLPFSNQPFQVCFNPLFLVHKFVVAHALMKKAAAFVPTFLFCLLLLQHTPGSEGARMLVGVHPWPIQPV